MAPMRSKSGQDYRDQLSPRELQVLYLICDGASDKQIAYGFGISEATVRQHAASVREKFAVFNRTELTVFALREEVIESDRAVRPAVIEVEWSEGGEIENIVFRYLSAATNQQMPETAIDLLNTSFAEYIGKGWRQQTVDYLKAIKKTYKPQEETPWSGIALAPRETGEDYLWSGVISPISETRYLSLVYNFPS